jgi:hypothetical protein
LITRKEIVLNSFFGTPIVTTFHPLIRPSALVLNCGLAVMQGRGDCCRGGFTRMVNAVLSGSQVRLAESQLLQTRLHFVFKQDFTRAVDEAASLPSHSCP